MLTNVRYYLKTQLRISRLHRPVLEGTVFLAFYSFAWPPFLYTYWLGNKKQDLRDLQTNFYKSTQFLKYVYQNELRTDKHPSKCEM
jgi:hypothetical protein